MSAPTDPLNPLEQLIFEFVGPARSLLDVGAGNGRVKAKLQRAGLSAKYSTLDRSPEFNPDYRSLDEVPEASFDAVLALEVIEHIPLADFDEFMDGVLRCLTPRGRLLISTPNSAFVGSIWDADMTHVHAYRAQDLAAYLHLRGVKSKIYRVVWAPPRPGLRERLRRVAMKVLTRGILQLDYARGVLLLGERAST